MIISDPVFILDNARIHHYKGLNETISELNLKLSYLPPYSPFLNRIEKIFSVWKNLVIRACARNEQKLKEIISLKFAVIGREHCDSFYRKMLRYIVKAERREEINE